MGQEEWLELESDPGLFTLLVEDLGVTGVQVDEIYELSKVPSDPVFGFIFLFRWQQNEKKHNSRRSSRGGGASLNASQASSTGADTPLASNNPTLGEISTSATSLHQGLNNGGRPTSTSSERRKLKPEVDPGDSEEIFFAHQVVPNSCATHSLLSILMNTSHQSVDLGPLLREFRRATQPLPPSLRGLAIGFMPPLMEAHNRHARQQTSHSPPCLPPACDEITSARVVQCAVEAARRAALSEGENGGGGGGETVAGEEAVGVSCGIGGGVGVGAGDTFHFVCFLPVGRFLYELDGLKQEPINHGPLEDPIAHVGWTRQCLDLLKQRMRDQEVRYNLMAVVPDRRLALTSRLDNLEKNRSILEKTIQQLTNSNATAVAIKLEHNGSLEPHSVEVNGAVRTMEEEPVETEPDSEVEVKAMEVEVDAEDAGEWSLDPLEGEAEADERPVTRAASRAAAAAAAAAGQSKPLKRSAPLAPITGAAGRRSSLREIGSSVSSPTSICIDLTEGDICATNNNALSDDITEGVITRRRSIVKESSSPVSKYPTRSSTKRDTLASHSLANTRSTGIVLNRDDSSVATTTTTAFLTTENLSQLLAGIEAQARACSAALAEEESKRQAYRVDAARRIHNYEPFIRAFLKELKEQGMLQRLVGEANASVGSGGRQLRKRRTTSMTPQKAVWSSSSAISTSSSTSGDASGVGTAGGALSRLAVKRARLTAVANRPSTRMSAANATSASVGAGVTSGRAGGRRRASRRTL
ncbi:ubiquitin carboxyl terminal hydrolase BAP1 [Echinococcus multilocularis]|uniref:ubiquitinyl hydrolase 1 n=1 Tax=Echinococcus multilocularis TaxID=6211 RepID=A0A087VZY5_ECHMU|nr:ubiquitin carboxyl terminal hydrolase BAP1 [Echinococcus multilocularis]